MVRVKVRGDTRKEGARLASRGRKCGSAGDDHSLVCAPPRPPDVKRILVACDDACEIQEPRILSKANFWSLTVVVCFDSVCSLHQLDTAIVTRWQRSHGTHLALRSYLCLPYTRTATATPLLVVVTSITPPTRRLLPSTASRTPCCFSTYP